jgi:hypothetical protein
MGLLFILIASPFFFFAIGLAVVSLFGNVTVNKRKIGGLKTLPYRFVCFIISVVLFLIGYGIMNIPDFF